MRCRSASAATDRHFGAGRTAAGLCSRTGSIVASHRVSSGMPLDVPLLEPCPFCAFLARERPYALLETGAAASIMVTQEQRGTPHLLVITNSHCPTLLDLAVDDAAAVMQATVRAGKAVAAAYDPPGIGVWQNNGRASNQTVPHFHVHLCGTWPDAPPIWGEVTPISLQEAEAIADRLRPHLEP